MGKTILVVEDEPNALKMVRDLLQNAGYKTLEATNGRQGVAMAKSQKPNLILMDILMPEMDDYAACYAIKTDPACGQIPIVMLTALGYDMNEEFAKRMGVDGYITKPIDIKKFLQQVAEYLRLDNN